MATSNRKPLRFSPVLYTSSLFHEASFGSIYLVCAGAIPVIEVVSFHAFFSFKQFEDLLCYEQK